MGRYRHPAMKQFADQQVRYAPQERKLEQMARGEALLYELVPDKGYPYQYICYRVTEYRPEVYPDLVLDGKDVAHDLRLFIEDLSASANLTPEEVGEPVLTVEDVSKLYKISTKTVNRWRQRGLVSRRFVVDGRRRVGFLKSSVEKFVEQHADEVERGSRFSQLSEEEKDEILQRARRLARTRSATLAEVSRRIARKMNRSPETVRYTIKNHDKENPNMAIFPALRGPLDDQTKQKIFSSYRRGIGIEALAEKYHRTRSTVYRIVNEMRAERIFSTPIEYMYHESFDAPDADEVILGPEPVPATAPRQTRPPAGLPPYLKSLYDVPLLSREQEFYLFRKMNYLLHKAKKLRDSLDLHHAKASQLDELDDLYEQAQEVKRRIIRSNLRLVVSIAKRHVTASTNLFELISDGNVSLMRAVEKFDFSRGFKFSTYASWAIMKNFARTIPAESTHRDRFVTGQELAFELAPDARLGEYEMELSHKRMQSAVDKILEKLDERERRIIACRYGLGDEAGPQTLEQVGNQFGVTKERIRQIEARAMNKLRKYASEDHLDISFLN